MSTRESYEPGSAAGASVRKEDDKWTLILVRDLHHPLSHPVCLVCLVGLEDPAHHH